MSFSMLKRAINVNNIRLLKWRSAFKDLSGCFFTAYEKFICYENLYYTFLFVVI